MIRRMAPVLIALSAAGCRQDMQIQPKYTPLEMSRFYPDGRSARPVPEGAVRFGETSVVGALNDGSDSGGFVSSIPLPVTRELLDRGRQRFDIYCAPCHGRLGDGHGTIASRGLIQPADLNSERVRNAPPGYIYQVIANGYGAMDDYAYQIRNVRDRWAIVAYIRALELSRSATLDEAGAEGRSQLEGQQ